MKLRYETVVFSAMGLYSVNGRRRRFSTHLLLTSSDGLCRQTKILLQNIHNKVCSTIRCPNSKYVMKTHYCELHKSLQ